MSSAIKERHAERLRHNNADLRQGSKNYTKKSLSPAFRLSVPSKHTSIDRKASFDCNMSLKPASMVSKYNRDYSENDEEYNQPHSGYSQDTYSKYAQYKGDYQENYSPIK